MKIYLKIILISLFTITLNSCSGDSAEDISNNNIAAIYIKSFNDNLANFVNKSSKNHDLTESLKYSEKGKKINSIILNQNIIEVENKFTNTNELNHIPNQFDKHIVLNIINSMLEDDLMTFFNRMEFYQDFIHNNIIDLHHKEYLINTIEEFKWLKYSLNQLNQSTNSTQNRTADFDSCFDSCMKKKISEELDDANWVDWTIFLATAAETTAGWALSCSWNCCCK